jgi:hypothetical protein
MGIVGRALWGSRAGLGRWLRVEGGLVARAAGAESGASRLRQSPGLERAAFSVGEIDREHGPDAGIAVHSAGAEHDHGRRQRDGHDVSQENGAGLQERGTVAIRRMVPPQSGQMAKSAAVSGRSPFV